MEEKLITISLIGFGFLIGRSIAVHFFVEEMKEEKKLQDEIQEWFIERFGEPLD